MSAWTRASGIVVTMKWRLITVGVVTLVLAGIVSITVTGYWFTRRRAFESNYSQIQIGDSQQKIIQLYGQPEETSDCSEARQPGSLGVVRKHCVEVYWYRSFMEQWIFYFDNQGKVIHKAFSVSY